MISKKQLLERDRWDWCKVVDHKHLLDNDIQDKLLKGHRNHQKEVTCTFACNDDLEKAIAVEKIKNKLIELGYETKLEVVQDYDWTTYPNKAETDHWQFTIQIGE